MPLPRLESLKIKAKLLQKAKLRAGTPIALKDAFALLAKHAGFSSWREWKNVIELHEKLRPPHASALWHVWYATYEEAKTHLDREGGYLLPYQKHYFITGDDYLANLGLDLADPDLKKVGPDFTRPLDISAFHRLVAKIAG